MRIGRSRIAKESFFGAEQLLRRRFHFGSGEALPVLRGSTQEEFPAGFDNPDSAFANPHSPVPAIGASGAISGVLGAYVILYPRARIVTLLFLGFFARLIEIPAWVYLPVWFLMQLFSGLAALDTPAEQGGVAWFAHIGGFVAGPILLLLLGGWRRRA